MATRRVGDVPGLASAGVTSSTVAKVLKSAQRRRTSGR